MGNAEGRARPLILSPCPALLRSADLNKLIPELMGVSTAVLESVVFVHQEDSCWPLAEDKVLKQKVSARLYLMAPCMHMQRGRPLAVRTLDAVCGSLTTFLPQPITRRLSMPSKHTSSKSRRISEL